MAWLSASALAIALTCGSVAALLAAPTRAQAVGGWIADYAPPPLPVYDQPPPPGPDYLWTPGYWAWDDEVADYFWTPGTWVLAPEPGLLWTPGYWAWDSGAYLFRPGYWGRSVGWYGGVAYGFGYTGQGFSGGYWRGSHYYYNTAANNVTNLSITNVYSRSVGGRGAPSAVSYNGGPGGLRIAPTPQQLGAESGRRFDATPMQMQHLRVAQGDRLLYASANRGAPPIAATTLPARFMGSGVVGAARTTSPGGYSSPETWRSGRDSPPPYARGGEIGDAPPYRSDDRSAYPEAHRYAGAGDVGRTALRPGPAAFEGRLRPTGFAPSQRAAPPSRVVQPRPAPHPEPRAHDERR